VSTSEFNVSTDESHAEKPVAVNTGRPPILEVAMSVSPSSVVVSKNPTSDSDEPVSKSEAGKPAKATG